MGPVAQRKPLAWRGRLELALVELLVSPLASVAQGHVSLLLVDAEPIGELVTEAWTGVQPAGLWIEVWLA